MRVVQSCIGKFHHFHLARSLQQRNALECIFTGYPWFKLRQEGLPREKVRTFPWIHGFRMSCGRVGIRSERVLRRIEQWSHRVHDRYTAQMLPRCDVFVGLSGAALQSGQKAQARGAIYICDRGSCHIRFQSRIMREEAARLNLGDELGEQVDPRSLAQEEMEYEQADYITVPSEFARSTFLRAGVPERKVVKIPYGADLRRFHPTASPDPGIFTVLFVGRLSLRKGVLDLVEAFKSLRVARKQLLLIGTCSRLMEGELRRRLTPEIRILGQVPNEELRDHYSRAHVLALPSLEEGLAYVMGEAMACGCPVVATENAGAADLFEHGREGIIIPARAVAVLAETLLELAGDPALRRRLGRAAQARIQSINGWDEYGRRYHEFLARALEGRRSVSVPLGSQ